MSRYTQDMHINLEDLRQSELILPQLTEVEWNRQVDEMIAQANETKGKTSEPDPPYVLCRDEYNFGLIRKHVTDDLIRQFADAVGDPNPLWRDPTYAATTRWGGIIAPPTFETCIANPSAGVLPRIPGANILAAGSKHEYFDVIRPGDEFRVMDRSLGVEEKVEANRQYRLFLQQSERSYINQREKVAAIATGRMLIMAYPPSSVESQAAQSYQDVTRSHFPKEELDKIHRAYEEELEGKARRGNAVHYWEDVSEGEELRPIVKGPLDICDCCARTVVNTYTVAFAIKWVAMKDHLNHHQIDPETGDYRYRRDWHYEDKMARVMGMPYAFADGIQNEMQIAHLVTNWMGDDGFVKTIDFRNRRINILGDVSWLRGRVVKKYTSGEEHLIDLELRGENQEGKVHTTASATIRLLSRSDR